MGKSRSTNLVSLACGLLLFLGIAAPRYSVAQDSASPVAITARPLLFSAPGVSSAVLVSEDLGSFAGESVSLNLEKVTLPPGTLLPSQESDGAVQLLVLEGDVLIQDSFGFSAPFTVDEGTTIVAGEAYELQNESSSDAVVLRLDLAGDSGSVEASPGDDEPATATSVEIDPIFNVDLPDAPPDPVSLFIGRATWDSGADSGDLEHTGPVGIYVTSGQLSATSPSGIEGIINAEDAVVIPSTTPLEVHNPAADPGTAILFGLFETGASIFTVHVTLTSPTPGAAPTAEAGATPLPETSPDTASPADPAITPTARVVSSPIPSAGGASVLYEANEATEFAEWSGGDHWQELNGLLVTNGEASGSEFIPIFAPFQTNGLHDYAVEAQIRMVSSGGSSFGLVVRASEPEGGYAVGVGESSNTGWQAAVFTLDGRWATDDVDGRIMQGQDVVQDDQWHTYRVSVRGNVIQLLIDGLIMVTATDDKYPSGDRVGLWASGSELEVRSFKVTALETGESDRLEAATPSSDGESGAPATDDIVVALPTATSEIQSVAESAAEPVSATVTFSYSDWNSGWRQDSTTFYGRPWTVVYGAFSQHPQATLSFTLNTQPDESAVLEVSGLDDEWEGNNEIEVLVNGLSVYEGPSPWLSYEGNAANFSDAQWTTAEFAISAGLLSAGSNTIVIANLEPAANFGSPPYILLSDTTLQFRSRN